MLRAKGLIQHVLVLVDKIDTLNFRDESAEFDLKKYRAMAELQFRLINKFLPDLKQVELEVEGQIEVSAPSEKPMTVIEWQESVGLPSPDPKQP